MSDGLFNYPAPATAAFPKAGNVSWTRCRLAERPFCELCVATVPKVNGVPVRAIERAYYVRTQAGQKNYYCAACGMDMQTGEKMRRK